MNTETATLTGDSPGAMRQLLCHVWGSPGQGPKVYLQAGLHADEMPGVLVLQKLMDLLDAAKGRFTGSVHVVPFANPIGLGHWISHKPMGRQDLENMQNFNRNYVDLAALAGDALEAELTDDAAANLKIVRRAFARAIADAEAKTDLAQQRLTLLGWAHDADYALDLHCDHRAVMHFYAAPARPEHTDLLGRCLGADLALMSEVSGGNAFDEALSASWAALKRRFAGRFPIPDGCYSATVEYRGQFDVSDDMARTDAANLMDFLVAVGAVESRGEKPRHKPPHVWPLGGCAEVFAPVGGVVTWECGAGDEVQKGQVIAHVTDTARRQRHAIHAPAEGLLFRTELWPSCLRGHSLAHVAGPVALGENKILSD